MKYDFSSMPNKSSCGSLKWGPVNEGGAFEGAFPMSTADMEFPVAPAITNAILKYVQNGSYCYTEPDAQYRKVVCDFMQRRHDYKIEPEWIVTTYGIVSALATAVRAFTNEGDGVIIQRPVYYPFTASIVNNNRTVVNNSLLLKDGRYEMNFDELEELCKNENNKMMILCSPHNPVGRVWTRDELYKVGKLCHDNNVILVSDEIHFDIVSKPHTVITNVDESFLQNTIVCTAISKSFNVAGLSTSNIIIADSKLREQFSERIKKDGYSMINCVAYPVTAAAYSECDEWLDEMNMVLERNYDLLDSFLKEKHPEIKLLSREGTYLVWLDVSALNVPDDKLVEYFAKNIGIVPNGGTWFGEEGSGYVRLNIAIPTEKLKELISR